jgi:hypothetical protein
MNPKITVRKIMEVVGVPIGTVHRALKAEQVRRSANGKLSVREARGIARAAKKYHPILVQEAIAPEPRPIELRVRSRTSFETQEPLRIAVVVTPSFDDLLHALEQAVPLIEALRESRANENEVDSWLQTARGLLARVK